MGASSKLLEWAAAHPVMAATPFAAGGVLGGSVAARNAKNPRQAQRRLALGAALGTGASMLVPGVRSAMLRTLVRQVHGLTGYVPKSFKPSKELLKRLAASGVRETGKGEQYWASLMNPNLKGKELARTVAAHKAGLSTVPGLLSSLRNPKEFGKNWWRHTSSTDKLLLGGFGGSGLYSAIKNKDPQGTAKSIGENLGWGLALAAPTSVWLPLQTALGAGMSAATNLVHKNPLPTGTVPGGPAKTFPPTNPVSTGPSMVGG